MSTCALRRVFQSPDLALALADVAGISSLKTIAATSRSHGEGLRAVWSDLLNSYPAEIYVFGGENSQPGEPRSILSSVEKFSPASGSWEAIPSMSTERMDCAAAACAGHIFVLGGENEAHGVLELVDRFDPIACCWSAAPPMRSARSGGAAAAAAGVLYALGGRGPGTSELRVSRPGLRRPYRTLDTVERLNVAEGMDRWEPLPPMQVKREYFAAVATPGRLCAIGGCNDRTFWAMLLSDQTMPGLGCDVLDFERGCWESVSFGHGLQPRAPWRAHHSVALYVGAAPAAATCDDGGVVGKTINRSSTIYIVGGYAGRLRKLDAAECLDCDEGEWTELPPMLCARSMYAATASSDSIYVVGGHDGHNYWASCERLNVTKRDWESLPPMSIARAGCAAAVVRR